MAIPIEGFCVVAKQDRIEPLLQSGQLVPPNQTALGDDDIWRCSFMTLADANRFLEVVEDLGLNVKQGPDSDVVLVQEFDQSVEPYCEWLQTSTWEKAVIGWMAGSQPDSVTAMEGWDPKVGSGLTFHDPSSMGDLEFVRTEGSLEVYRDLASGREVYVGRTSTPVDGLFTEAAEVVSKHFVSPGSSPVTGDARKAVEEAVSQLDDVLAEAPGWWNAYWYHGKGHVALGNYEPAYRSFRRAFELETETEAIPRELAGVCLQLNKFDEAVEVAEKAVALVPDSSDLLGNLALALLLVGRLEAAETTIAAALKHGDEDAINKRLQALIADVAEGRRPQPQALSDLTKPTRRRPFWKFW